MSDARRIRIRGIVQGVGFRPFVYRLAHRYGLCGWVLNAEEGVRIHAEGSKKNLTEFAAALESEAPPAAEISRLEVTVVDWEDHAVFEIRHSTDRAAPTVRISADLSVCEACSAELLDPTDRRFNYPYINCTDCGPRYSIIEGLPYDRPLTTMRRWPLCANCEQEYHDPLDRRFHAQPVACPECGPTYTLVSGGAQIARGRPAIEETARRLSEGALVAVKGLGGYHLACNAADNEAVARLRQRKFRKEKPFAVMVADIEQARDLVEVSPAAAEALTSVARPIVVSRARRRLPGVAPENRDLGVMLAYTPLHLLLFEAGAPPVLVMTSANRSSEPIAYRDDEARQRLDGLAELFLVGERPIARRVDDSVVRVGSRGPMLLRRARGYAPGAPCRLPLEEPVLAVGADLKNTVTLAVGGEAFVSQHVGDLGHLEARRAFEETIRDLVTMYQLELSEVTVVHDLHPEYASTLHALELPARRRLAVQHHRAHIAAVAAEKQAFDRRFVGAAFDGTGYGDDGSIWGGEFFVGSVRAGFERVAHLRQAPLPGGDGAARHPVQAAAGFLSELDGLPSLSEPPFDFPQRYHKARRLLGGGVRVFETTSVGRLFDTVAAIAGFTRPSSFEGQAAMWLEHLAESALDSDPLPLPFADGQLDYRPALEAAVELRRRGVDPPVIAAGFHLGLAAGIRTAIAQLCELNDTHTAALSGGVFQNRLLLELVLADLEDQGVEVWTHAKVPPNDGGISLGQAALVLGPQRAPARRE